MKAYAIADRGVEWCSALEIKEILGVDAEVKDTLLSFNADYEELCRMCLESQATRRFLFSIGMLECNSLESMKKQFRKLLSNFDLSKVSGKSFRVTCEREGEHDYTSHDVERELGAAVVEVLKDNDMEHNVSLDNPDVIFYCHIYNDICATGIDLCGKDLTQRDYKVYSHPSSIRGGLGYSLVRMGGFSEGKTLLDPFCGSGVIPIEAAYMVSDVPLNQEGELAFRKLDDPGVEPVLESKDASIHAFDNNLNALKYGKNNAAIGLVDDRIGFSKCDIEWLDTKFEKSQVDMIVTQPPQNSKYANEQTISSVYDELFYQAKYVLADDGCIVVLMTSTEVFLKAAEKHGFKVIDEKTIVTGDIEYSALKLMAKA